MNEPRQHIQGEELEDLIRAMKDHKDQDDTVVTKSVSASKVPRKIEAKLPGGDTPHLDSKENLRIKKDRARKEDVLIQLLKTSPTDPKVADRLMEELAEELLSLKLERESQEEEGKDITQVSGRRVTATKALLEAYFMKRKEFVDSNGIDFRGEEMKIAFSLLFSKITSSLVELGIKVDLRNEFLRILQKNMEGFEEEIERLIREQRK